MGQNTHTESIAHLAVAIPGFNDDFQLVQGLSELVPRKETTDADKLCPLVTPFKNLSRSGEKYIRFLVVTRLRL
jgi:hypothetical protein